jgi:hypothetical protein
MMAPIRCILEGAAGLLVGIETSLATPKNRHTLELSIAPITPIYHHASYDQPVLQSNIHCVQVGTA